MSGWSEFLVKRGNKDVTFEDAIEFLGPKNRRNSTGWGETLIWAICNLNNRINEMGTGSVGREKRIQALEKELKEVTVAVARDVTELLQRVESLEKHVLDLKFEQIKANDLG